MPDVPVFACIVYVSKVEGGVRARVANLAGIEVTAANERMAIGHVVTVFKQRVADMHRQNETIPWISPPAPIESGEQQRYVPAHL